METNQWCENIELTDKNLNFDPPSPGLEVRRVAYVAAHISVPPIGSRLTLKYLYQSLKCSLSFTLAWGYLFSNYPKEFTNIGWITKSKCEHTLVTYRTATDLLTIFSFVAWFVMGSV